MTAAMPVIWSAWQDHVLITSIISSRWSSLINPVRKRRVYHCVSTKRLLGNRKTGKINEEGEHIAVLRKIIFSSVGRLLYERCPGASLESLCFTMPNIGSFILWFVSFSFYGPLWQTNWRKGIMSFFIFLTTVYLLVAFFAAILTYCEQQDSGGITFINKVLGFLACACWPITVLLVVVSVLFSGPSDSYPLEKQKMSYTKS